MYLFIIKYCFQLYKQQEETNNLNKERLFFVINIINYLYVISVIKSIFP